MMDLKHARRAHRIEPEAEDGFVELDRDIDREHLLPLERFDARAGGEAFAFVGVNLRQRLCRPGQFQFDSDIALGQHRRQDELRIEAQRFPIPRQRTGARPHPGCRASVPGGRTANGTSHRIHGLEFEPGPQVRFVERLRLEPSAEQPKRIGQLPAQRACEDRDIAGEQIGPLIPCREFAAECFVFLAPALAVAGVTADFLLQQFHLATPAAGHLGDRHPGGAGHGRQHRFAVFQSGGCEPTVQSMTMSRCLFLGEAFHGGFTPAVQKIQGFGIESRRRVERLGGHIGLAITCRPRPRRRAIDLGQAVAKGFADPCRCPAFGQWFAQGNRRQPDIRRRLMPDGMRHIENREMPTNLILARQSEFGMLAQKRMRLAVALLERRGCHSLRVRDVRFAIRAGPDAATLADAQAFAEEKPSPDRGDMLQHFERHHGVELLIGKRQRFARLDADVMRIVRDVFEGVASCDFDSVREIARKEIQDVATHIEDADRTRGTRQQAIQEFDRQAETPRGVEIEIRGMLACGAKQRTRGLRGNRGGCAVQRGRLGCHAGGAPCP
jgi:hypothetical protein